MLRQPLAVLVLDPWGRPKTDATVDFVVLRGAEEVATRFEKLAVNYSAMIDLAIIQRLLRIVVS